ncbi:ABC transporter ATP-binding protein [Kingella kingae]|uniref:ABC transporter ATP-binding protein n=1 Tax=Kingella kingae TaxID=504 RepID=UPI0003F572C0|nr:ABC transporter ATP-binding protein [Kingella kingae]MDK4576949.1 ABC transporter ATP-binding protein [Kingella kingae]MDK4582181.1 ABC transporter ATP-binding protein [Kingella kingae]MDK4593119.1 ABC transporter ATP-binding protein [Kingella kingae]MDK4594435.1 ABC transporter ATP-binding protein [Kingella kingae]MDK4644117.1 ABC transporter ATP-binding protein [Kingella kingae]
MSIEFQNVAFAYGDLPILHNVNFSIEQGKFAAIMGGSGSGKTTLMRLITGQLSPTSGTILINGENLADFSAARLREHRRKMGVLFQHGALFTDLNVYDNIAFPMRELTQLPEEVIRYLVILKLHAVGLRGVEKLMPAELSGGMARRVALARTIALDPDLILYDEPFTGLDPISLGVIAHLIHRANKALCSTSIMVTHDVGHSLQLVDQIIFLAHGEILFSGSPQEMEQSDSEWIRQFVQGLPNGPVAFRYPAETTLKQDLL